MRTIKCETIDEYISTFPDETQKLLWKLYEIIKKTAPAAEEKISYGMPSFHQKRQLVYFAGYKSHIGFYPGPKPIAAFKTALENYKTSKGTIQFPLDKPLPTRLIIQIVKFRIKESEEKLRENKIIETQLSMKCKANGKVRKP